MLKFIATLSPLPVSSEQAEFVAFDIHTLMTPPGTEDAAPAARMEVLFPWKGLVQEASPLLQGSMFYYWWGTLKDGKLVWAPEIKKDPDGNPVVDGNGNVERAVLQAEMLPEIEPAHVGNWSLLKDQVQLLWGRLSKDKKIKDVLITAPAETGSHGDPHSPEADAVTDGKEDLTWSACVSQLSQSPVPMPQHLRLSHVVKVPKAGRPDDLVHVALAPVIRGIPVMPLKEHELTSDPAIQNLGESGTSGEVQVTYAVDGITLRLRTWKLKPEGEPPLLPKFLKASVPAAISANWTRNWREGLPLDAGHGLNLLRAWILKFPATPYDRTQLPDVLKKALSLAHDTADLGLRRSALNHDAFPKEPWSGTLAEALWRLACPTPEHSENNQKLVAAISEAWEKWKGDKLYTLKVGTDDWQARWVKLVDMALAVPGADLYPNLSQMLKAVYPTPKEQDAVFTDPAIQKQAFEELYRLMQDDSVLVDLFLMQWEDWTKDGENNKLRAALDQYLGLSQPSLNYRELHGKIRSRLSDGKEREVSLRYGDGIAGLGWRFLAEETQKQSIQQGEDVAAEAVFTKALQEYVRGFPASDSRGFNVTLASLKFGGGSLAVPDGIIEWAREYARRIAGARVEPAMDVPPLSVPLPNEKRSADEAPVVDEHAQFDPDEMNGVIVFARRQRHESDNPSWECPTVGDLVLSYSEGKTAVLAQNVVVPWTINRSLEVQRRLLDYRGRPLGMRLAETASLVNGATGGDDALSQSAQALALPGFAVLRTERRSPPGEEGNVHGRAPALIYDRQARYQFLFSPVLNGGYLHPDLTRKQGDVYHHGFLLPNPDLCCQGYDQAEVVTITRLMRRTPVGSCRICWEPLNGKVYHHFREKTIPPVPNGVRPIADDLAEYHQGFGQPPRARPATLFLASSQASLERGVVTEFRFSLRPPALALNHWIAWVKGAWSGGKDLHLLVQDVDRLVRGWLMDKAGDVGTVLRNDPERQAKLGDANSFLDDPAVIGVWVSIKTVLSNSWQLYAPSEAAPSRAMFFSLEPETDVQDYQGLPWDPVDENRSNLEEVFDAVLKQITPYVQNSVPGTNQARQFVLECVGGSQPSITDSGNLVTIRLPKGGIYEVEIQPVIDQQTKPRFADEIMANTAGQIETLVDIGNGRFRLPKSTVRWWVETEPVAQQDLMPSSSEVWQAVTPRWQGALFDQTGADSYRPRGGGMEVAICPRLTAQGERDLKWLFVGKVNASVQKWEWNGIPQRGDKLAAAARKLPWQNLNEPESVQLLHTLLEGEAAAFGEEEPTSAHLLGVPSQNPGGVPFTTDFATTLLLYPKPGFTGDKTALMECIIDAPDPADAVSLVPQYCRAAATVYSRYFGIASEGARESLKDFPGNPAGTGASSMRTPWRRALLPGMVRELGVPRIKMVMPLMIPRSGHPGTSVNARRPGFIALVRETLPSPFHQLVAELVWTRVSFPGIAEDLVLPELGPDPLTSIRGLLPEKKAQPPSDNLADLATWVAEVNTWLAPLRNAPAWVGQPAGLSYEVAARSKARFPNMAVFFDYGDLPLDLTKRPSGDDPVQDDDLFNDDFFLKVAFRWIVTPASVTCKQPLPKPQAPEAAGVPWIPAEPASLRSSPTLGWQLRTVSAFDTLLAQPHAAVSGTPWKYVSIDETSDTPCPLSFQISATDGSLSLWHSEWRSKVDVKPVEAFPGGANSSLVHALLFVAWHEVYDFLSSRYQRAATHLYLLLPEESPFNILSKLEKSARDDSLTAGQFFLCCFSKEALEDLKDLRNAPEAFATWLDLLFPLNEDPAASRKDGAGQIIRSSLIIPEKK